MKMTKDNLNSVIFENQNARLMIEDVLTHTCASLYYYHERELTEAEAFKIWRDATAAEEGYKEPDYGSGQIYNHGRLICC